MENVKRERNKKFKINTFSLGEISIPYKRVTLTTTSFKIKMISTKLLEIT